MNINRKNILLKKQVVDTNLYDFVVESCNNPSVKYIGLCITNIIISYGMLYLFRYDVPKIISPTQMNKLIEYNETSNYINWFCIGFTIILNYLVIPNLSNGINYQIDKISVQIGIIHILGIQIKSLIWYHYYMFFECLSDFSNDSNETYKQHETHTKICGFLFGSNYVNLLTILIIVLFLLTIIIGCAVQFITTKLKQIRFTYVGKIQIQENKEIHQA